MRTFVATAFFGPGATYVLSRLQRFSCQQHDFPAPFSTLDRQTYHDHLVQSSPLVVYLPLAAFVTLNTRAEAQPVRQTSTIAPLQLDTLPRDM
jgi:hypothetical protein